MADVLIEIESLYKLFGNNPAKYMPLVHEGKSKDEILAETGHTLGLKDINLQIKRGEIFVIMGLSGSGKSTLIRHFNRLIDPTEGVIKVEGTDVMQFGAKELQEFRRHKMSMVFQRFGLLPHKNVVDNVSYGLQIQGVDRAEAKAKAVEWLDTVGLAGYEDQYPSQLSGGQQQRVGLARALCTDAEILLMDEAFSALDPLIRSEMQDQLIKLQETLHKTIVFITHDLDEALRLGDRIAILKDGEVVQQGEPEDILLNPATEYVEAFVRDVNRARALTVETVMKDPAYRITAETIEEALKQMKGFKQDYGYVVNDEGFQGVVTEEALKEAYADDKAADLTVDVMESCDPLEPGAVLESVIPCTLESEYPLPVVDEDGNLTGRLSRGTLSDVLGERSA
ncbi:quaternary amine ABC transporter ATP-binding protein [Neptuniibacter caesariensis]|uniref:Quaternary amine transport ATP-binding protein n=1 Tax=Neptuniibacter caesariensis TaxID=207954 RepID=A0A7U8C3T8_NEPCE|nr:glycine betaine/L-proline ABC transporter ATP-binding protein [Neptuniibacter caesariensis]EAR59600.1 putative glycine betaine ABC transporter ATP-binding protein [Oceanospirillum sp. MED92] [Neptuniibacter caesariensis]